jgi:hypothetical protein
MADNVAITAGSGVTVGADEVTIGGASQKLQRIKVYDATNDSTNALLVTTRGSAAVEGALAADAALAGNPVRVGVRARSTISGVTAVTTNDVTELNADVDGTLLTRAQIPLSASLVTRVADTSGSATNFTQLNATTLLRNYVTSIHVYNNGATSVYVDLRNGSGGAIIWSQGAPVKAPSSHYFSPPLRQPSTNTALAYDTSAAIGGSGVLINVTGFQSAR